MSTEEISKKTPKDIDSFILEQIANHKETIYGLQYNLAIDRTKVLYLNLELHEIFKIILPFLKANHLQKDIDYQWKIQNRLQELQPFARERRPDESGQVQESIKPTKDFYKYKLGCDKRETHLNECMMSVGIIGKLKVDTKRLR